MQILEFACVRQRLQNEDRHGIFSQIERYSNERSLELLGTRRKPVSRTGDQQVLHEVHDIGFRLNVRK